MPRPNPFRSAADMVAQGSIERPASLGRDGKPPQEIAGTDAPAAPAAGKAAKLAAVPTRRESRIWH